MAKRRVLNFNFGKMYELIETLEENKEKAVIEAIGKAKELVQPELDKFFDQHKATGKADESLIENPQIENNNGKISMRLGFDKSKPHGYLAYYFEHGTPRNNPAEYKFINYAFRAHKVRNVMRETLKSYMKDSQEKALKSNRKG